MLSSALSLARTSTACDDVHCLDYLQDLIVYDILARYQSLRVLEDLWLERQLSGNDYFAIDESPSAEALTLTYGYQVVINCNELYREGGISSQRKVTPETVKYTTLNTDQRARFYFVVTGV
jgi:hypothetical protein